MFIQVLTIPTQEYFLFCIFPGLAAKPLRCFYLHNQSVDTILWSSNLGFKALVVTSEFSQCYAMNTCTSLPQRLQQMHPDFYNRTLVSQPSGRWGSECGSKHRCVQAPHQL